MKQLPINCAGRMALWIYPRLAVSRFPQAPAIVESTRSYEMPDFDTLPEGAEVTVEIWGGTVRLHLDGERRRIYTSKYEYISFDSDDEAGEEFLALWKRVELLRSVREVEEVVKNWLGKPH